MWQKIPAKRLDVRPFGIAGVDLKSFVVTEDVGSHQRDKSEQEILGTQPLGLPQWQRASRQSGILTGKEFVLSTVRCGELGVQRNREFRRK